MGRAELSMNHKYLVEGLSNQRIQAYFSYMVDVAVILGANKEQAEKELFDVLKFEIEMAKVSNLKLHWIYLARF